MMGNLTAWIGNNWNVLVLPLTTFALTSIALLWLRRLALARLLRYVNGTMSSIDDVVARAIRVPSIVWCVIIAIYLSFGASSLEASWRALAGKTLWSLLVISIAVSVLMLARSVTDVYGRRARLPAQALTVIKALARVWIIVVAALVLLGIWGAPVSPIVLSLAVILLVAALALRDSVPNFFAGLQLSASQRIRVGDYVKLQTGEEGYVTEFTWNTTQVKSLEGSLITIPNSRLLGQSVMNYGRPLKKASEPFRFYNRDHITELTGLRAGDVVELRDLLKVAPDPVVYYHTHHFVEEHHFLVPEPSNDFAYWVVSALGDNALSERLAAVSIMDFSTLAALRERFVGILDEYLAIDHGSKEAAPGMEFHFMKSIAAVIPTEYVAGDLREFIEALRKVSESSIYFHLFESRLRLGRGQNDFSTWLENNMAESELAREIAHLDIYSSTLEAIRSTIIRLIEKTIK
jgi:small-conductance mechanosensitive channel